MATVKQDTALKEEIIGTAKAYGQRLGFLIAALDIDDDVKEALLAILPAMTPEQVERFSDILESAYLGDKTFNIDIELKTALERVKTEYDVAHSDLEKETMVELGALATKVNQTKDI